MRRLIAVIALSLAAYVALGSLALGAQETVIYAGSLEGAPFPITVGGWGSGTLQEVEQVSLEGLSSLRLASQGDFQGGRIDFSIPLDISAYASEPNAYIEIWVRPHFARAVSPTPAAAPTPVTPSAPGAPSARVRPTPSSPRLPSARTGRFGGEERMETIRRLLERTGAGEETRRGIRRVSPAPVAGAQLPSITGAYGTTPSTTQQRALRPGTTVPTGRVPSPPATTTTPTAAPRGIITPVTGAPGAAPAGLAGQTAGAPASAEEAAFRATGLRIELLTDRGLAVLPDYPLYPGEQGSAGWVKIGFPLHDFDGLLGDKLERLIILSNRADTIYIGEVKLSLETSSIYARPLASPAITRVGQPVTFVANASAGLSPLEVSWDFDAADGVEQDAVGQRVMNVYTRPGAYEATVTIRDATGASPEIRTYQLLVQVK